MPTRSSELFSTGVPVSAQLRLREIERTTWLVAAAAVLDPLRFVQHDQVELQSPRRHSSRSRSSNFVVGDLHRRVGQTATAMRAAPGRLRSTVSGISGAHSANSRCQLVTSGLGHTSSTTRISPRAAAAASP